jgi:hypothetical protein
VVEDFMLSALKRFLSTNFSIPTKFEKAAEI